VRHMGDLTLADNPIRPRLLAHPLF
jgi:hypothetical protein